MEPQDDGSQLVIAEAPHAEMFEYAIDLRSMTQAEENSLWNLLDTKKSLLI